MKCLGEQKHFSLCLKESNVGFRWDLRGKEVHQWGATTEKALSMVATCLSPEDKGKDSKAWEADVNWCGGADNMGGGGPGPMPFRALKVRMSTLNCVQKQMGNQWIYMRYVELIFQIIPYVARFQVNISLLESLIGNRIDR